MSPDTFENPIMKTSETCEKLIEKSPSGSFSSTSEDHIEATNGNAMCECENEADVETTTLSTCRKILFGLAAPPLQMTSNICGFFFSLFLLEVVHMSPLMVSVIIFVGRAWDGFTDPLVGQLVFRTKTKIGRTKPWLIAASLLGPLTFFFMWFHVDAIERPMQKFFFYFVCYLAYCTAITCYHVPYTSSTVLISNKSKDKDGATAARIGFELIFTIIGSLVFGVIISKNRVTSNCNATLFSGNKTNLTVTLRDQQVSERQGYMLAAGIISVIYFICGIVATVGIKERVKVKQHTDSFFKNIRSVLTFKPYLLLMGAFLFMSLGIQIVQANLGLYTTHSMKLGEQMQYGIFTVLAVAVICVPFWYKMAERFGKKNIFICGLLPMYPCLVIAIFMPQKCIPCYYAVCGVAGLSISVAMLLPWSMLPDVIDAFYVLHKDRKESVFYSLYVFFTKFASGVSLALSQVALGASGYNSDAKVCGQPESVGQALRILVGPGPALCLAISALLMFFYPIDKKFRRELDKKLLAIVPAIVNGNDGNAVDVSAELPIDSQQTATAVLTDQVTTGTINNTVPEEICSSGSNGSADSGFEEMKSTQNLIPSR